MPVGSIKQMLGYRAYAFFARLHCPNALSGFSTEGEIEDIEANRNRPKPANKMTALLKEEEKNDGNV